MKKIQFGYTRKEWYNSKIKQGYTKSTAVMSVIGNFSNDLHEYTRLYKNVHWNKIACTFKSNVL